MTWVLLFMMQYGDVQNSNLIAQRLEFETLALCEQASRQMIEYNTVQVNMASKYREANNGVMIPIYGFETFGCYQTAE
jgi:hypothetical protein